jgi:hypothetical protein
MNEIKRRTTPQAPVAEEVEQIVPGLTLEWFFDRRVSVLTLSSIEFEAIDAWLETAVRVARERPAGQPHLGVHDMSSKNLTLTPYLRKKVQEAAAAVPEKGGRVAVVGPQGPTGSVVRLFANTLVRLMIGRPIRIFASRQEALVWLAEALE